ncbi:hypothetical protein GYMLUDRAFT_250108 [Collybiopsis luxurians FD-317 M1]|uniref:Uncharacterized protein n=1 Tax=Collybiopsis luxurians FD-317 M1 TaxID=944289 RepID=A0A0D0BVU0_9AGAR|nr:hypothetical protein GYMLUDRAFT_250108 [Collybiopsis luxurians FD-317 M1]
MATVLIGHALEEYASGYRVESMLSVTNLGSHYCAVTTTLTLMQEKCPAYVELLQTDLFNDMMSAGPEIVPAQTYNYNTLNNFASQPKQPLAAEEADMDINNQTAAQDEQEGDIEDGHDDSIDNHEQLNN